MSSSQDAFQKRERAAEEVFFRQEERLAMLKRLEKLVAAGRLDASVLEEVRKATSPDVHHASGVEVSPGVFKDVPGELKHRTEYVYAHTPGGPPPPKLSEADRMRMTPHADMGPSKWNPDGGASIFSLSESLAEAPGKTLPPHEAARLARIQARAGEVQVPTVFGYKLMPGLSPGRMFFWGSVLAVSGTAALVAASARGFGPRTPGEAVPGRAPGTYASPLGERLANLFMPWRNRFAPNPAARAEAEHGEFVRRLKESMVASKA